MLEHNFPPHFPPQSTAPQCFQRLNRSQAHLSRMRSPMTSRSNCAKDNRMFKVRRPIDVVVLNVSGAFGPSSRPVDSPIYFTD